MEESDMDPTLRDFVGTMRAFLRVLEDETFLLLQDLIRAPSYKPPSHNPFDYCFWGDTNPGSILSFKPKKIFDWDCGKCIDALAEALDKMIEADRPPPKRLYRNTTGASVDASSGSISASNSGQVCHETTEAPIKTAIEENGQTLPRDQDRDGDDIFNQPHIDDQHGHRGDAKCKPRYADHDIGEQLDHMEDIVDQKSPQLNLGSTWDQVANETDPGQHHAWHRHHASKYTPSNGHCYKDDTIDLRSIIAVLDEATTMDDHPTTKILVQSFLRQLLQRLQDQQATGYDTAHHCSSDDWTIRSQPAALMCS
jgi:hypothetical protein